MSMLLEPRRLHTSSSPRPALGLSGMALNPPSLLGPLPTPRELEKVPPAKPPKPGLGQGNAPRGLTFPCPAVPAGSPSGSYFFLFKRKKTPCVPICFPRELKAQELRVEGTPGPSSSADGRSRTPTPPPTARPPALLRTPLVTSQYHRARAAGCRPDRASEGLMPQADAGREPERDPAWARSAGTPGVLKERARRSAIARGRRAAGGRG